MPVSMHWLRFCQQLQTTPTSLSRTASQLSATFWRISIAHWMFIPAHLVFWLALPNTLHGTGSLLKAGSPRIS